VNTCNPDCVVEDRPYTYKAATIDTNPSVAGDKSQRQDVLGHETGHVHDARTNTQQYQSDSQHTAQTHGRTPHDSRPEEQRANNFKQQIKQERKQYRKEYRHDKDNS